MECGCYTSPEQVIALEEQNEALRQALVKTLAALDRYLINPDKNSVVLAARAVLDKQVF